MTKGEHHAAEGQGRNDVILVDDAALTALTVHTERFRGQRIGAVLTGGNVTPEQMQQWL